MKGLDRRLRRVEAVRQRSSDDLGKLTDEELFDIMRKESEALSDVQPQVLFCLNGFVRASECRCGKCAQFEISMPEFVLERTWPDR